MQTITKQSLHKPVRPPITLGTISFKGKAFLFLIPIIIIISFIYTIDAIVTERKILRQETIKKGETIADIAAKNAELPILSENIELLKRYSKSLKDIKDIAFVELRNMRSETLIHEGSPLPKGHFKDISPLQTMSFSETPGFFGFAVPVFTVREGKEFDMLMDTGASSPVREHIGWIIVGLSKDVLNKTTTDIIVRSIILGTIFTFGGIVLVFIFVNLATRPLNVLFKAVKGIRKGEFSKIDVSPSEDEIGKLTAEFNRMSQAIQEREEKIAASGKIIKSLFDRVEHAIFRLDRDGNIVETNKKFDELCSGTNKVCTLFTDGTEKSCLAKAISGEVKNLEQNIIGADGNELTVMMSIYPDFDKDNNVMGFDGYFVDITEKKKLEETLIQTQKLESVGLLAGGIAHDFNNILTGILGYSSLMKSMMDEDDSNYQYVDTIEKAAIRATTLTHQLLGFARKGKYKVEKLDVNEIVKELVIFMRETFDRSLTILPDLKDSLPFVEGDSNQLYQAIMNMCINARDAMPDGGKLYIKTEYCLLEDEVVVDLYRIPAGNYVKISVTDTGTGMSPEIKKRIFEPFYTTKSVGKGTGLGLAMVYGIIKNHAGYINVYSEIGVGTTLSIYLPKAEGTVGPKIVGEVSEKRYSKATILLLDDEEVIREMVKDMMKPYGYSVITAGDGKEGIRLFEEHKERIDLVILDMIMPQESGKQVFKKMRIIKPEARILICSGYGQEQYFHELFEAGAYGFLQKPFRKAELLSKVEAALKV
jgi:signal transduction histidine kinase/HAMP domain-containing protein